MPDNIIRHGRARSGIGACRLDRTEPDGPGSLMQLLVPQGGYSPVKIIRSSAARLEFAFVRLSPSAIRAVVVCFGFSVLLSAAGLVALSVTARPRARRRRLRRRHRRPRSRSGEPSSRIGVRVVDVHERRPRALQAGKHLEGPAGPGEWHVSHVVRGAIGDPESGRADPHARSVPSTSTRSLAAKPGEHVAVQSGETSRVGRARRRSCGRGR